MPIQFHTADIQFSLEKKKELRSFITAQAKAATGKKIELNYVFCSDEFLLNMNKQFLEHDYYTDIITFPLSESEKEIEAEIYISVDRVKENATKLKVDFNRELNRVIFHGVLHLVGFKDKTSAQKTKMRSEEDIWLSKFSKSLKTKK